MATNIVEFDPAKAAAFTPTADQRRLLNMIHDYPSIRTMREFCEACDIGRRTYYNWCQNPHFRLWFATAWSARIVTEGVTLINQARAKSSYKIGYWNGLRDLIFDPRGLGLLQKWQQAIFAASASAFECGPEADPGYDFHFDPTSECDDGKPRQTPPTGGGTPQNIEKEAPPAPLAALETPAENGTFRAPFSAAAADDSSNRLVPSNCLAQTVNATVNTTMSAPAANPFAESIPTPVAVARHFRRALEPRRRHRSLACRNLRARRAIHPPAANRLNEPSAAPRNPNPNYELNCLTETVSQTHGGLARSAWSEPLFCHKRNVGQLGSVGEGEQ